MQQVNKRKGDRRGELRKKSTEEDGEQQLREEG